VLLHSPLIADLIHKGEVHEIKTIMAKSNELGMKTFDQALFDLYEAELITYDDALRNADSMNELRLRIKLEGKSSRAQSLRDSVSGLSLVDNDDGRNGYLR
jgi:twitching motility protein PilU